MGRPISAVLFDLDGTLIDSAPDLASSVNAMRLQRGQTVMSYEVLRPHAGSGARGMLEAAFGVRPAMLEYDALKDEFYGLYAERLLQQTCLFDAVAELLDDLDARRLPWGIVTNKALRFAHPGASALGLLPRARALVAGDSTPYTKPHPEPLLEAARRMRQAPETCVYVGDDLRDMQAGRAAGMATLAAAWGYLGADSAPQDWEADRVLQHPIELLHWLDLP
jgi:phosphoglycolate phosphatase